MKKSFKKAIAAILAVLMVVCTMPFTALADPGDYNPDIRLQFGTCAPDFNGDWQDYSAGTAKGAGFEYVGLYDVPVDFDYKLDKTTGGVTGNLYIDKDKANTAIETYYGDELGMEPIGDDIQFGEGDYFTITVMLKNSDFAAGNVFLTYSDNVEPAAYYSYTSGRTTAYAMGTITEVAEANKGASVFGGDLPIAAQSAMTLHANVNDSGSDSYARDGIISCQGAVENRVNSSDLTEGVYDEFYCNPETGAMDAGYTYYGMIWETFMFKITGPGPITFAPLDTDNTNLKTGPFGHFFLIAKQSDGGDPYNYTTYAINKYNTVTGNYDAPEAPGSAKFTFFGYNTNRPGDVEEHEHSFVGAVPEYAGNSQHKLTCTADGCPGGDDSYQLVACSPESANNAKDADCVTPGKNADTICSVCKGVIEEGAAIPATNDHNYTAVSNNDGESHTMKCAYGYSDHDQKDLCSFGPVIAYPGQDATVNAPGKGYKECSVCHQRVENIDIPQITCEHKNATWDDGKETKPATCKDQGEKTFTKHCPDCNKDVQTRVDSIPVDSSNHVNKHATEAVEATCVVEGFTAGEYCDDCNQYVSGHASLGTNADNHKATRDTDAVEATCEVEGFTAGVYCDDCSKYVSGHASLGYADHKGGVATCTTQATCDVCSQPYGPLDPENHDYQLAPETAEAPTFDAPGKEADLVCSYNPEHVIAGKEIPKLVGYDVTIDGTHLDMGTVTINGEPVADEGETIKFEAGSVITLEAKPVEGAKFVGWIVNGKTTMSTEPIRVATVLANITYTPVFEIAAAEKFTVKFVDNYNNIISVQSVANGSEIEVPAAPNRPGYTYATENGWNLTNDQIAALEADAVITAQYTKNEEALYTVTAPEGATITVNGAPVEGNETKVPFDTKVTVTKAGTEAWTINGVNVGYGDSYTFFVTANVTLGTAAGVKATPSVAAIAQEEVVSGNITKVVFTATRTMAPGYKYINSGFVYGKNAPSTIQLKDVDGSAVKAVYNKTDVEQFNLTYGLSAQQGTMTVRAFIVYADAEGTLYEAYAEGDLTSYTYKN